MQKFEFRKKLTCLVQLEKDLFDLEEFEKMVRKPKRFKKTVDSYHFDIIGTLMNEMGLTGENLTRHEETNYYVCLEIWTARTGIQIH